MVIKRKCKLVNKKVIAGVICGVIFLSAPQVGNASSSIASAQPTHNANVAVNIGTDALVVDITVPGTVAFAFNADGSNDIPDNFTIINHNKLAYFYLKKLGIDAGESGWKIASKDENVSLDEKTIKMKVGLKNSEKEITPTNGTKDKTGTAIFSDSEFVLAPEVDTNMSFVIDRPIYTEKINQAKAFDMNLEFEMK